MSLPEFSYEAAVRSDDGKQDKIELVVQHFVYRAQPWKLDAFRNHLGSPPSDARGVTAPEFGSIFLRPEMRRGERKPLRIRTQSKGALRGASVPLFGGSYVFDRYPFRRRDAVTVRSELHLDLNATRFIRYQSPDSLSGQRSPSFFRTDQSSYDGEEFSLDGKDNWIPLPFLSDAFREANVSGTILRSYYDGVLHLIERDVERARSHRSVRLARPMASADVRPISIRRVESYFEFSSPIPTATVLALEPLVQSFNDLEKTAEDYPIKAGIWKGNSRAVTVRIRQGVELLIYAKTNRRIRFEVRHALTDQPRVRRASRASTRVHQTVAGPANLCALLADLRTDAANIVNEVLGHLRDCASVPATDKTTVHLLFDIARTLGSSGNAHTIIDILCNKGSVSSMAALAVPLRKLKAAGILRTQDRNSRREYVVTAPYKYALQMLQLHGSVAHLTTRYRTRNAPP